MERTSICSSISSSLQTSPDVIYRYFEEGYEPVLKSWSIRNKAEQDADKEKFRPKQTWATWLNSKKPRPLQGPFMEWKFPLNLVSVPKLPSLFIHIPLINPHVGPIYYFPDALPISRHHGHDPFHTRLPCFPCTHKAT